MTASTRACAVLGGSILGIGLGSYLPPAHRLAWWVGVLVLAFLGRRSWILVVLSVLIGILYVRSWRELHTRSLPPTLTEAVGWISEAPDVRAEKTFYTITLPEGRILAKAERYPRFHYGQWVTVSGAVEPPEAFSGFDYPRFLEKNGVFGIVGRPRLTAQTRPDTRTLRTPFYAARTYLEQSMQRRIPEPESSFLGGILLGSKRAIPEKIQEDLRTTGTSHMVAISGANITIMLGLALNLLPLRGRWSPVWAAFLLGSATTILTGGSASVVRGAAVAVAGRLVRALGRRAWPLPLILLSMGIMLLVNPLYLVADPGFQLSFAAFAGLLFTGPWVTKLCERLPLPEAVKAALAETTAATLGTAPLSLIGFGQLSLLGLIVNPLILWLLPSITALGLLYILLSWSPLATPIAVPLWLLLHLVLRTISFFGRFTFGTIKLQ